MTLPMLLRRMVCWLVGHDRYEAIRGVRCLRCGDGLNLITNRWSKP